MSTGTRYVLFQIPGWVLAAAVLGALWWEGQIGGPVAWALFGVWVLKDVLMYPLVHTAYEPPPGSRVEGLVGARAVARERLDPRGYVAVRGELWRAEVEAGRAPVAAGRPVRVRGVDGFTLLVAPDDEPAG